MNDPQSPLPANPFAGAANREARALEFWKPGVEGEALVGKLDRIESARKRDAQGNLYSDTAVFSVAVTLNARGEPVTASRNVRLAINANLQDRVTAHDSGSYFRILFRGGVKTGQPSPVRTFGVQVIAPRDAAPVVKWMAERAAEVEAAERAFDAHGETDDLPF